MAEVKNNEKREANDKLGPISAVLSIVSDVIGIAMLPDNVIWLRYIILGLSIVLLLCLFRLLLGGHWRENMFETSLILVTLIFSLAVFFYLHITNATASVRKTSFAGMGTRTDYLSFA